MKNVRQRLNKACSELSCLYHDISVKLGLSDSESMILYLLYDAEEPLTQSEIANATGLSKQTLHSAVRKLEGEGIVTLEKLDAKSKQLVVTQKGAGIVAQKIRPLIELENRVLASWPKEDQLKFLALIEQFKDQFEHEVRLYEAQ